MGPSNYFCHCGAPKKKTVMANKTLKKSYTSCLCILVPKGNDLHIVSKLVSNKTENKPPYASRSRQSQYNKLHGFRRLYWYTFRPRNHTSLLSYTVEPCLTFRSNQLRILTRKSLSNNSQSTASCYCPTWPCWPSTTIEQCIIPFWRQSFPLTEIRLYKWNLMM